MEPDHLREDLKSEVILIICELPEERLMALYESKGLEFYTVKVILNLIKSNTSPFAKMFRNQSVQYVEHEYLTSGVEYFNRSIAGYCALKSADHPDEHQKRVHKEEKEDQAIGEIENLYWYDAEIIRLRMEHGSFRAIEKKTGIPYSSCFKTFQRAVKTIQQRLLPVAGIFIWLLNFKK